MLSAVNNNASLLICFVDFDKYLLILKPIYVYITVVVGMVALGKEAKHHASKAADSFRTEETIFHLGQFYEMDTVGRCQHIVEILVGGDAQPSMSAVESEFLLAVVGLS